MTLTSPEHDALIVLAGQYHRCGHTAAFAAIRAALRAVDAERYTTLPASPSCTLVIDRWDGCGWIADSHAEARGAELAANALNTRNIRDGQAQLRASLPSAERSA